MLPQLMFTAFHDDKAIEVLRVTGRNYMLVKP